MFWLVESFGDTQMGTIDRIYDVHLPQVLQRIFNNEIDKQWLDDSNEPQNNYTSRQYFYNIHVGLKSNASFIISNGTSCGFMRVIHNWAANLFIFEYMSLII